MHLTFVTAMCFILTVVSILIYSVVWSVTTIHFCERSVENYIKFSLYTVGSISLSIGLVKLILGAVN